MKIDFKPFACIMMGICFIGFSIGLIVGIYLFSEFESFVFMYGSAPCLGIGSGLVIYGTLYGRS